MLKRLWCTDTELKLSQIALGINNNNNVKILINTERHQLLFGNVFQKNF